MRILRGFAVLGVAASVMAAIVSCSSDATTDVVAGDASVPDTSVPDTSPSSPVADDSGARPPNDAGTKSDASDANPPTTDCSKFVPVLCDFDGTCPNLSAIGAGTPGGYPTFAKDAGPDGSTAFSAFVDAGGGMASFGMPFWDMEKQADLPVDTAFPDCQVVCEANMRVAAGASANPAIVFAGAGGWELDMGANAGTEHSSTGDQTTALIGTEWKHVRVVLSPNGPSSTVTITDSADASTTTSVGITKIGVTLSFGALVTTPPASGVQVFVDDVQCAVRQADLQ